MMKRMLNYFWVSVLPIILGCAAQSKPSDADIAPTAATGAPEKAEHADIVIADRKIIKEGELRFETDDIKKTRFKVEKAVTHLKGYISKESEESTDYSLEQTLVIRVPSTDFDRLVDDISKGVSRFDQKRINAVDVTEEYLDAETRIRVKKEVEKRYIDLLTKAQTVEEILAIEKQMADLRTEIESMEGRLKYLENRVSYSTLTVVFYKKISVPISVLSHFKIGLSNGWNGFMWFLIGLVNIWPVLLFTAIGIFGFRAIRKRRKAKREASANKVA